MNKQIKIIISEPQLLISLLIAPITIFFIILLKPIISIRIGFLHNDRLGHFTVNTELYLCKKLIDGKKDSSNLDLFYLPRISCNKELEKLWKKQLIILPYFFLRPVDLIFRSFKIFKTFTCKLTENNDRDVLNLIDKTNPNIILDDKFVSKAKKQLVRLLPNNKKFICIICRDSAYLDEISGRENITYHDYRNTDINKFNLVAEEFTNRGLYVIRMGSKVNQDFKTNNPMIIDYANSSYRSEILDIFLGANCELCISTGTGFDGIPLIFRRPVAYVNYAPLCYAQVSSKKQMFIPRHYYSNKLNRKLTAKEIYSIPSCNGHRSEQYVKDNISLIDNTPEEILNVSIELFLRNNNEWNEHSEDSELQNKFWSSFPKEMVFNDIKLFGNIKGRIGSEFLRENIWWLD